MNRYGIRPHRPRTPEEDERARQLILSTLPPLTGEDARRLVASLEDERAPMAQCSDMGMGVIPRDAAGAAAQPPAGAGGREEVTP